MSSRKYQTPSLPPLVGIVEATEILGISKATIHRWINDGYLIEPVRISSGPVWAREDIERFRDELGRRRAPKRSREERLEAEIQERRDDKDFQDRLTEILERDREIIERLAQ